MDDLPQHSIVNTYVIRVWRESALDAPRWRGRIEHLQSGRRAAFLDPERILAFIRASGAFTSDQRGDVDSQIPEVHDDD